MISQTAVLNAKILIVDDLAMNITLLERILSSSGYLDISSTLDPIEVAMLHQQHDYDLILLDIEMPEMDGFQVLEALKKVAYNHYLPVIAITAQPEHKMRAFDGGAKDFISKPFEMAEVLARVQNIVQVCLLNKALHKDNAVLQQHVKDRTADLQESFLETIFTMTRAAEQKDEDTGAHVQRISYYSRVLARVLGLNEIFVDQIFFASPMHDIGKIGIPDHILLKPSNHSLEERAVMQEHTIIGAGILGNSKSAYLKMAADIALNHHERWDGSGYPSGKKGEDIPLAARIMSICDIYDALRSQRPYKPAFDHLKAMDIIRHGDGRTKPEHFDPVVFKAFIDNHQLFAEIFELHSE